MRRAVEERIRSFLAGLSPRARGLLLNAVQRAVADGSDDPALGVILTAAEPEPPELRFPEAPPVWLAGDGRLHDLRRAFFSPLSAFLTDAPRLSSRAGAFPVESAAGIWAWLQRDALAAEVASAAAGDDPEAAAAPLRALALTCADEAIAAARRVSNGITRLEAALGGEEVLKDLRRLAEAFSAAGSVPGVLLALPPESAGDSGAVRAAAAALAAAAAAQPERLPWLYAAVLRHSGSPAATIRIAIAAGAAAVPAALADSPHAAGVDVVLTEIEAEAARLVRHRAGRGPVGPCVASIRQFDAIVRETAAILDLTRAPRWAGRLGAAKERVSAEIEREIDGAGGIVRRVLGPRAAQPDATDVADAERALAFLAVAEEARDSLALNQSLASLGRDVGKLLSGYVDPLVNGLRGMPAAERDAALPRADVGIRLAELFFGADYAASLRRIRAAALGTPGRVARAS